MYEERVLTELQDLGFTEYQSKAYLAVVKLGRARPTELSEESGVPQARIYDIIDDLQDLGLIEVYSTRRGKEVSAPPPGTVLDDLKRRRIDEISDQVAQVVSGLEQVYDRPGEDASAYVSIVNRKETAIRHIRQALETAEWWISLSVDRSLYRRIETEIRSALERNVTVRLIIRDEELKTDPDAFPENLRVRYRQIADTFVATDREYALFSSKHPAKSEQPYIIIREKNLVLLFQNYVEQVWPASEIVEAGDGFPIRYLDPWHAIIDLEDELGAGEDFHATVWGYDTDTHEQGTWEGRIVDYTLAGPVDADYTVLLPVEASLTLETDDGRITVGGWKAVVEDVAAYGLKIAER